MDLGSCTRALDYAVKSGRRFACRYCGCESLAVGKVCVCSNCEMPVYPGDVHDFAGISQIKDMVEGGDYQDAMKAYDSIYQSSKDPAYLYAEALLCIKQSNLQVAGIRYNREGFMEENATMRDAAAKFASTARGMLNDAINACLPQLKGDRPPLGAAYTTFMCQVKLSNLREAGEASHLLDKIDSEYLGPYSRMVLNLNLNKYDEVVKDAEALLKSDSFSINAIFYIAMAFFDKKNYSESRKLAELLDSYLKSGQLDALKHELDEVVNV